MRSLLLIVLLAACGAAGADPDNEDFEVHRIDVGYPSAAVLVVDQDEDGSPDLFVAGDGGVTVLRGDGAGHFAVHEVVEAGENPVDLAEGDLDRDGWLDLVVANHETDYLTLLYGGPEGLSAGRPVRMAIDVSPHPHAVAVTDIDEDGRLDIVVDDRDRERLRVYRGAADGTFEAGEPIGVGGDPYRGMTVADVDGDGHLDVITPNRRTVAVRFGDGSGVFSAGPDLDSRAAPPFSTAVGDFDGDGIVDLAAGSGEGPGGVMVWLGRGGRRFEPGPHAPYPIADGPTRLNASDVNGDGLDDVLVTSYLGNEVAVLLGGRDDLRVIRIGLSDHPWDVDADDLNGDGRVDLVTANDGGNRIAVLVARGE